MNFIINEIFEKMLLLWIKSISTFQVCCIVTCTSIMTITFFVTSTLAKTNYSAYSCKWIFDELCGMRLPENEPGPEPQPELELVPAPAPVPPQMSSWTIHKETADTVPRRWEEREVARIIQHSQNGRAYAAVVLLVNLF